MKPEYLIDGEPVTLDDLLEPINEAAFGPGEKDMIRAMRPGDKRSIGTGGAFAAFELERIGP